MTERPTPVILGTDFWWDCDDAVAIRVLSRMEKLGYVRLLGVAVNTRMEITAPAIDAFLQNEGYKDIPLGITQNVTVSKTKPVIQYRLAALDGRLRSNEECEDGVKLYRRLLAESKEPVDIIEIGFHPLLTGLLNSEADEFSPLSGEELIKKKVRKLWAMAGKWDDFITGKECNFSYYPFAIEASTVLCERWPTEITFLGWEVGNTVITGGALKKDDLLYLVISDLGFPNGRSSWDPLTVYLACIGNEEKAGFDTVRGRASLDPVNGYNHFEKYADGPHKFVVKKFPCSYYEEILNKIIE